MVGVYTIRSKMAFRSPTGNHQDHQNLDDELAHIGSWANINNNARKKAATDSKDSFTPSGSVIQSLLRHPCADQNPNSTTELPNQPSPLGKFVNSIHPANGLKYSHLTTTNLTNVQDGPYQLELWKRDFRCYQETFSLVASGVQGIEQTGNLTTDYLISSEGRLVDTSQLERKDKS